MYGDSLEDGSLGARARFISAAVSGFVDLRCPKLGGCLRDECADFVSIGIRRSARLLTFKGP